MSVASNFQRMRAQILGRIKDFEKKGTAKINKVSAMKSGLAEIIQTLCIIRYFECPETDLHIAENACCIDYAETWLSEWVHWQSTSHGPHCGTSDYECEETLELYTGVTRAGLPITGSHKWVASKLNVHRILPTVHNRRWMDHCEVCHGSVKANPILDPVDVEEAHSHIASCYHSLQWHGQTDGRRDVSLGYEEISMEWSPVLCCIVSWTETMQLLCWSDTNDGCVSQFHTFPWSFPAVAIAQELGQGHGYQSWQRDIIFYPIPTGHSELCGDWMLHQTLTCAGL